MGLSVKRVQFALRATPGLQSVTGVGFQGIAVMFIATARTADGLGNGVQLGVGYAVSPTARRSVSVASNNTGGASANASRQDSARAFQHVQNISGAVSVDCSFDLSSFDSDGFTINVDDASSAGQILVQAIVFGGTDLLTAEVFSYDTPTVSGTPTFTGLTARPKVLLISGIGHTAASGDGSGNGLELYHSMVAENPGGTVESCAFGIRESDAANPAHNGVYLLPSRSFMEMLSDDTVFGEGQITGMTTTGFTTDFTTGDLNPFAQSKRFFGLALGGTFLAKLINDTAPTANGQETFASVGVGTPRGLLSMSAGYLASDTDDYNNVSISARAVLGAASGTTAQGVQAYTAVDNAVARTRQASFADRFVYFNSATADTSFGHAVVDSIDSDGWKQTWSNKDAAGQHIAYLALGDSVGPTAVNLTRTALWNVRKAIPAERILKWNVGITGPDPVSGLVFADGGHLSGTLRFSAPSGHRILFREGSFLSGPSSPTDVAWTLAEETAAGSGIREVSVTLPLNDTVYTAAVYTYNGSLYSVVPMMVKIMGVPTPGPLILDEDVAAFAVTTALAGFPIIEVNPGSGGWQEGAAAQSYSGRLDPSRWRLMNAGDDVRNPTLGVPLPFSGWPAASQGKLAVLFLPAALTELTSFKAYHEIARPM